MLVIKDFATTILASALTAAATSVVVSDASRLPALSAGDYYYLVLQKFTDRTSVEVVKVTGADGNTLTVVRAQAGTTAKSFAIGDYAEQRITVGTFSEYIAQAAADKVDKSGGVVEQSLGLLNTGDLVKATVGISYDATNGHGTILSGGEGANKLTPHILLRPFGMADASVQAKYGADGSLILTGGSRYVETGLLSMKHPSDANGWPNATNSDANNYNNRARGKIHVNNNALYFIADAALNARRFGIQAGHEHPQYATSYGILDLNPYGGVVRVNGGIVYHTGYVPTPAAVGALALSGGTITGTLDQNIGGYGARLTAASGYGYLQGGKVGGDTADQKLKITGISATALTEFDIITAGHGIARVNGARIYTEQYVPTPSVLGVVPQARTINSKPLTSDITLSAADVGAVAKAGDAMTGTLGVTKINHVNLPSANQQLINADTNGIVFVGNVQTVNDLRLQTSNGVASVTIGDTPFRIYHAGFKPSPEDAQAFRSVGVTATVDATPGVAWDARSGVYTSKNTGDSDLVAHFFGNGSCPALQVKARYRNGGLWYRSARDYLGFEESWTAIYTTKNKPTPADVGAVAKAGDTMTGNLTAPAVLVSSAQNTSVNALTRKDYVDSAIAAGDALQVSKTGDTMTGDLTAPKVLVSGAQGTEVNALTRKDYVDSAIAAGDALQVSKTGDTMTGDLTAPKVLVSGAQGTEVNALTRKDYVDTAIAAGDALQVSKTGDTMSGNLTVPKVLLSAAQGAEANAVARRDFVESTVTASGKGVKDLTIALPAGAPTSGYIPVLFRTNSTSNSFVFIDTRSIYGSEPMNNCSFLGNVRAGGWSDSGSYAYGQFTIYEVSERAIHSIHGQSETADGFVVYVETRAFPIRVRVDIETTVTAHATDVTFGTSVFKVDGQVSGNTKTSVLANFDKGSGTYRGSNRVYDNGYNPTPEAVGALPVNGNAVTASRLQTARLIAGVPFDGTSNISISATNVGAVACNASGIVSQAVDFKACRGIYTGSSVTPLELGHGEGTPKTFYIDIHTDTSADFNYRWTYAHGASGVQFSGTGDFSDIYIRSDKRLKTNLAKIGGSLDKVRRLTGYEFDKAVSLGSDVVHREVGLLADDVQAVLPYAVRESVDEEAIKTISPSALIALLVEAIKELDERTA